VAISTDMALEGTHFRTGWLSTREIGWRAAAAALSDLAAVAAEPAGVLVSLGVPAEQPDEFAAEIMDGVGAVADAVGAKVWGGDLVRSDRLALDVLVVGRVEHPVLRAGARPGDALWLTGRLGGPAAALADLLEGRAPAPAARERFAHPAPRVREAQWLRHRGARAMIDLSDGLAADAGHLAAASGVRCMLDADLVPRHEAAESDGAVLSGGEEFELLVALPLEFGAGAEFERTFLLPLTKVGRVEAGAGVVLHRDGVPIDLPPGFRHF